MCIPPGTSALDAGLRSSIHILFLLDKLPIALCFVCHAMWQYCTRNRLAESVSVVLYTRVGCVELL